MIGFIMLQIYIKIGIAQNRVKIFIINLQLTPSHFLIIIFIQILLRQRY